MTTLEPARAARTGPFRLALPRAVLAALLVAASATALAASSAVPSTAPRVLPVTPQQADALGVRTEPIGAAASIPIAGLPATVAVPPAQQRVVSAPLAGLLERVAVAPNDPVKAGQPLGRLASPALVELQRGYVQADVQARLAADTLARDTRLHDEGLIAESRLVASRAHRAEAAAQLAERRQALQLAGISDAALKRLAAGQPLGASIELVAPIDGVVVEQSAPLGARVEAAAPLFTIAKVPPLWLEVQVPVALLPRIPVGSTVRVPAVGASGRVLSVARRTGASQSVAVRAELRDGVDALVPGQAVEAEVVPAAAPGAGRRVPAGALVRHEGTPMVFVKVPQGFAATPVRVLDERDAEAIVEGPFRGDERVAVRGTAALKAKLAGIGEQ